MTIDVITTDNGDYRTFSASQINKLYNCPRMWAYEYIEKLKPEPTYPMKKGTYIHAVVEEFNESLGSLEGKPVADLKEILRQKILKIARDLWEQGLPGEFEEEMRENHQHIRKQFFNYVETLIKRFHAIKRRTNMDQEQAWYRARPSVNELSVLITDDEGKWLFRGDIDSVFEKHPLWFDRTAIIDYKTGKSPFNTESPMSVEYSRQLDIYGWLYYQAYGCVPEVVGIHFLAEPPDSPNAFLFKEIDLGTIESTHLMVERVRELAVSDNLEDYPRNQQFKWCEFQKNDGSYIRCDHWDYCLGDEEMPEPENREYDGPEREPVEVVLKDPLEDDLTLSEHAPSKFLNAPVAIEEQQ